MGRPLLALVVVILGLGLFTAGLAWLLDVPRPPAAAPRSERLFYGLCASCHGTDGRGSWRAALFLIRPGDLTDGARLGRESDRYLFDIVKNGGAPIGRPGMPAFGSTLSDADIEALVAYVRTLGARAADKAARGERVPMSGGGEGGRLRSRPGACRRTG